jgi:hypothetical protein
MPGSARAAQQDTIRRWLQRHRVAGNQSTGGGNSEMKGVLHVEQVDPSKCYHFSSREEAQDLASLA